jgi:hypothetical protein
MCLRMNCIHKLGVFYKRRINQQKLILETIMDLKILSKWILKFEKQPNILCGINRILE